MYHVHPVGMENIGNTCYANASFQLLLSIPELFNRLYSRKLAPMSQGIAALFRHCLATKVGTSLFPLGKATWKPNEFRKLLSKHRKAYASDRQQDAEEFLRCIVDNIVEEEKKSEGNNPTSDLFCLKMPVSLTCNECHESRFTAENDFQETMLRLDILSNTTDLTIQRLWEEQFQSETLDNKERVYCENCCEKTRTTKKSTLEGAPPKHLLLHLKRFQFSGEGALKTNANVRIDPSIKVATDGGSSTAKYELQAVLKHLGETAHSGHYVTYAKRGDKWFLFDDHQVQMIGDFERFIDLTEGLRRNAYVLLYSQCERPDIQQELPSYDHHDFDELNWQSPNRSVPQQPPPQRRRQAPTFASLGNQQQARLGRTCRGTFKLIEQLVSETKFLITKVDSSGESDEDSTVPESEFQRIGNLMRLIQQQCTREYSLMLALETSGVSRDWDAVPLDKLLATASVHLKVYRVIRHMGDAFKVKEYPHNLMLILQKLNCAYDDTIIFLPFNSFASGKHLVESIERFSGCCESVLNLALQVDKSKSSIKLLVVP